MKQILWLVAAAATLTIVGCSDDAKGIAGPAAGLYFFGGELIDEVELASVSTQDIPEYELPPEFLEPGFGIVAADGRAAFVALGGEDICCANETSVNAQFIEGPSAWVWYGKLNANQLQDLPEGPESDLDVKAAISGNFEVLQNYPISEINETGLLGNATVLTDPLTEEDEGAPCAIGPAVPGDPRSLFLGNIDLFEPGADPIGEFNDKGFCAELNTVYTTDNPDETYGFGGGSDGSILIDEYEQPSSFEFLVGDWDVFAYEDGPISDTVTVEEDGSFSDNSEECSLEGQFSIIDEDFNVYGISGSINCEGTNVDIEGLFTLSDFIESEFIDICDDSSVSAQPICIPDAVTQDVDNTAGVAIVKISFKDSEGSGEFGDVLFFDRVPEI